MILLKKGLIIDDDKLIQKDILINDGKIVEIEDEINVDATVYDCTNKVIFPGGIDVHVHLREPGFEYKETIKTGTLAAAKGGFTTIMSMPNLNPVPDTVENLKVQQEIIEKDAVVHVYPYCAFTKGEKGHELADLKELIPHVKAISDDGVGVNNLPLLLEGMKIAKENDIIIASHAEDALFKYAPAGEYVAVKREIEYVKEIGCKYHFCHMSTKESFEAIKKAQEEGYPITCEVAPHHMFLNEQMINGNPNFKMNPPLRSDENRLATIQALLDGTACMIASDHAPHSEEEKQRVYEKCPNGIIGIETMIPLIYTNLVKPGIATFKQMQEWFVENPSKVFDLPLNEIKVNAMANLCVLDIDTLREYKKEEILSKSFNSPFIGTKLYGWPILTICDGKVVYKMEA